MKNLILLSCLLLSSFCMFAQNSNIGIGTTSPQANALLDITSTTKGFLLPRMTYAQKIAIPVSPTAAGLLVYQTNASGANQSGLYYYDGSLWKRFARFDEIGGGGNNSWTITADDQYSNLAGNVGIGTSTPTSKLHVVGSVLQEGSTYALNHASGILQFRNSGINKSYVQLSGNNLRLGTNSGNTGGGVVFRLDGTERMVIDSSGNVGIGTTSPNASAKLDVTSTTQGILLPRVTTSQMFAINNPADGLMVYNTDYDQPAHYSGGWKNILNSTFWSRPITVRDRIANSADSVGIGNSGPLARLHVSNGSHANYTTHNGHIMVGPAGSYNLAIGDYEILARNNGEASPLYLQHEGGLVRIGNGGTATTARLQITDGAEASLTTHGDVVIGETTSGNIVMDENEIQARNDGAADELYLQQAGGLVRIGDFDSSPPSGARLQLTDGADASLSQHGYLLLGEPETTNITVDNNEIQARVNGGAGTLYLQNDGGAIDIGGHTTMKHNGSGEVLKIDGINPNIGLYQNGVYKSFIAQATGELYIGVNGAKLHLDATQIAIGGVNTNAPDYKLTVSGKVICEELKVELYNNWPDYVFNENYNLKPLHELKSFIETNNHLPNIPKASEVATEGIELGEMNRKLLEKVEELTLYIIDLQEQIDELKAEAKGEEEAELKAKAEK